MEIETEYKSSRKFVCDETEIGSERGFSEMNKDRITKWLIIIL